MYESPKAAARMAKAKAAGKAKAKAQARKMGGLRFRGPDIQVWEAADQDASMRNFFLYSQT